MLDLSLQLPGPFCTMMMADYGAHLIKVDEPNPRVRNPFAAEEPGTGPLDRYLNRGKRSATLNLKTEEGKSIFLRLAGTVDVLVEGIRPGVVRRLGIGYEEVSAVNPRIVYCSISGSGQDGPMRDVPGHDVNYLSLAGVLGLSGRKGDAPTLLPVQLGDVYGGSIMALAGILMALLSRGRTGKGAWLDVSMTDGTQGCARRLKMKLCFCEKRSMLMTKGADEVTVKSQIIRMLEDGAAPIGISKKLCIPSGVVRARIFRMRQKGEIGNEL